MFLKYLKRIFGVFACISALLSLDLPPVNLRKSALKCSQIHSKLHLPAFRNTLYNFKIAGYYLYFTSFCTVECMHVHAGNEQLSEGGSGKFYVKSNGDTVLQNRGKLNDREIVMIQRFIKQNYKEMYMKWASYSNRGFYGE